VAAAATTICTKPQAAWFTNAAVLHWEKSVQRGGVGTSAKGTNMADSQLKQKVHNVLKGVYFKDREALVDVSDGSDDSIHVVIVSRKFDGRRMKEKNDLIWSVLVQNLSPDEWGKISLSVGASPEEIKAT